jgi:hypothetical protein
LVQLCFDFYMIEESVSAAALNRGNRMVARLKGLSCLSAHHSNQQLTGRFTARSAAN